MSFEGRLIFWSIKGKKQIDQHNLQSDITCASTNKTSNILVTGHSNGVIRFYSIAKTNDVFLLKEFKLTKSGPIDQVTFSSKGD